MSDDVLLINAQISKHKWKYCYISEDKIIYSPVYDINNNMIKTGEEIYKSILNGQHDDSKKELNETELLQKQLLETQNMLLELQEQILLNKQIK